MPSEARRAVEIARTGELLEPRRLLIQSVSGERFPSIAGYEVPDEKENREEEGRQLGWDEYAQVHGKAPF